MEIKISLVIPPSSVIDRYPQDHPLRKGIQVTEPLGLGYLAAMIQDIAKVEIIDCIAENLDVLDCAYQVQYSDIVGISVVTSNVHIADKLGVQIKKWHPHIKIVYGGIHPSLCVNETLQNPNVDIVVIKEGEYSFREIVEEKPLHEIRGIAYRKNDKVIVNPPRAPEKNLDNFPFPTRHLLKMEKYRPFLYLRKPVHSLIASRGCPFTCTYCCRDISGKHYRVRKPEKVVEEVRVLVDVWDSKEIAFQDPVFGLTKKWVNEFCHLLKQEKLDVVWSALTRVDLVDKETLKNMKESGAWMIYYGIEAGNQQLLDNIKKRTDLEMIRKAITLTNEARIKTWGSFMFALPGETPELAEETLEFTKSLPLDFASFHLTTPFLGTELRDTYEKWGTMKPHNELFTQLNPVFVPWGWQKKEEELKTFFSNAFRQFYLRPSYILREFLSLNSIEKISMFLRGLKVI